MSASNDRKQKIERIRARLALLDARQVSVPDRPVDERELIDFERRAGRRLPDEFREFVTSIGVGGEGPGGGLLPIHAWGDALLEPSEDVFALSCPLDPARGYGDYADSVDPAQGAIAIASDGAGAPYTLLVISGPHRGRLARYDPDTESCVWIERAWPVGPVGFFEFYEGWLDLRLAGGVTTFYGSALIGTEESLLRAVLAAALPDARRARACSGLTTLRELSPVTRDALRDAYADLPPLLRAALVTLVAGETSEVRVSWRDLLHDPSPMVRCMAVRHLRTHRSVEALALVASSVDDPDDAVAEAALLASLRTPHLTFSTLERLFERPNLRVVVVSELSRFPSARSCAMLVQALRDPDVGVRRVAAFSIGTARCDSGTVVSLAHALESEPDVSVRNAIQRSLEKLKAIDE